MTQSRKTNNAKYAVSGFLAVLIFVIIYKIALNQCNSLSYQDIKDHLACAESIYLNSLKDAWLERPYLFWHLCVKGFIKFFNYPADHAAACTCGIFALLTYLITFFITDRAVTHYTRKDAGIISACAASLLSLVQPFYVSWFNTYQYEGQFSINPIFNPTHMAVKPIGLLAFAFAIDIYKKYKNEELLFFKGQTIQKYLYPLFSACLLLSTFTKPTFIYMFIPTGLIFVLIDWVICLRKKDGSAKNCWNMIWKIACACIPSLIYLLIEYAAFYLWGGTNEDASVAIYPFLTAWKIFSPNVLRSIFLAMAFPLWMLVTNPRYFIKTAEGRLGVLSYIVGALEFSLFVETGSKLTHLNFSWPMMSGMLLFWVAALIRLLTTTQKEEPTRWDSVVTLVGWILLSIHLFSGLYYINPSAYLL